MSTQASSDSYEELPGIITSLPTDDRRWGLARYALEYVANGQVQPADPKKPAGQWCLDSVAEQSLRDRAVVTKERLAFINDVVTSCIHPPADHSHHAVNDDAEIAARTQEVAGTLVLALGETKVSASFSTWPLRIQLRIPDGQGDEGEGSLMPAATAWLDTSPIELPGNRSIVPRSALKEQLGLALDAGAPLPGSVIRRVPTMLRFTSEQALDLVDAADSLRDAGFEIVLPESVRDGVDRLTVKLLVTSTSDGDFIGARTFHGSWQGTVGRRPLDRATLQRVLETAAEGQYLVRHDARWIAVDPAFAARFLRRLRARPPAGVELIATCLSGYWRTPDLGTVPVTLDAEASHRFAALRNAGSGGEPELVGIEAQLRDYQRRGSAWLQKMAELGLGAVLADDMGLGKTLQTIVLLASRSRHSNSNPHLVICPTSVLGNWKREIGRFAPALRATIYHGPGRHLERARGENDVVLTSYAVLRRDADRLAAHEWDTVVLDEAQQIKNEGSATTQCAHRIANHAVARVALTGTPVENRLSDLWSILQFVEPGLLGGRRRFSMEIARPIELARQHLEDELDQQAATEATERLHRITGPFIMRRLKAEVAKELPDKTELIDSCPLTAEQERLYRRAVRESMEGGLGEGFARAGRILRMIGELRQICDHPEQSNPSDGGGDDALALNDLELVGRSGKFDHTIELLQEIAQSGERTLVFTQYRRMGRMLAYQIGHTLGITIPFLHGGVDRVRREAMVDEFQNSPDAPPVLVISLRAGGTGLNLTRATHVLHYDRWWNPAVEDQATDRAHRIGQTEPVTVHTLVTAGTIEDHVADLLARKRDLANLALRPGESWIGELTDAELIDLVSLDDTLELSGASE